MAAARGPLKRRADGEPDEEAGRGRARDPARRARRTRSRHGAPHQLTREADHAGGAAHVFDAARNLLLLDPQAIGGEQRIGLRVRFRTQPVHEAQELGVPRAARIAIGEVFRHQRIKRRPALLGEIAVEEALIVEMMSHVDLSRPRSLRTARNKCTRTVDSFRPVMALMSRGEQSP